MRMLSLGKRLVVMVVLLCLIVLIALFVLLLPHFYYRIALLRKYACVFTLDLQQELKVRHVITL